VVRRSRQALVVAVEADAEVPGGRLRVEPSPDEVTPKRIETDLRRAEAARGRGAELRAVLLGERPAAFSDEAPELVGGDDLDPTQLAALEHALRAEDVALVHGPPGTGKTRTLAAVVRSAAGRGDRVLCMAPSHTAVDNLVLRLEGRRLDLVRLGHPARVLPVLEAHTLDARLEKHEDVRLARKYARDARQLFEKATRFTRAKPERGAKAGFRQEAKALLADARRLEAQAAERILDGADVVLCTLGVDPRELGDRRFDLAVVDEAGQATEASTWRAVIRADRLVLGGDHLQLPPTVISREAAALGFAESLFERLMGLDPGLGRRLERQYRMHRDIMGFSNEALYDGALEAAPEVAGHRLCDLPGVDEAAPTARPLFFVDTAGAGFEEETGADGASRSNPREAEVLFAELSRWLEHGVPPEAVGVITPYAAQARLLRDLVGELPVEIDTVDGFQGREKEGILVSLVRSNPDGEVGFLAEHRRINVALTRARRGLFVIGDGATLAADPFYEQLIAHAAQSGGYVSIWEHAPP
jgi:superfamily I DNA and/or RNA helicase